MGSIECGLGVVGVQNSELLEVASLKGITSFGKTV